VTQCNFWVHKSVSGSTKLSWEWLFLCCGLQQHNIQMWLTESLQQPTCKAALVSQSAPRKGFCDLPFLLVL
jgi:hypothetical protein